MKNIRINKFIANFTNFSRRKADELISDGKVKINGEILKTPGYIVTSDDEVEVLGEVITARKLKFKYYVFNKPVNVISAVTDDRGRVTVRDFFNQEMRLFPVGRLDYKSSGLIIMTNDGELANKLAHPSGHIEKSYLVQTDYRLSDKHLRDFAAGVDLDGRKTLPCFIDIYDYAANIYIVKLKEGRNRQIRRMIKYFGKQVVSLKRIAIGKIKLGRLEEGKHRPFTQKELEYIRSI